LTPGQGTYGGITVHWTPLGDYSGLLATIQE